MKFVILTEVSIKITFFWDVMPCSLVDTYQCLFYPEDRGGKFLQNIGTYLPNDMATHPRSP
jgi:hypothetical protein